jgi:8-hydroxy-5-deazaflavin:NADPH oxidoreductase
VYAKGERGWEKTEDNNMKIAIIGAGNVGTALGAGWSKVGHQITYGMREPDGDKAKQLKAAQPQAAISTNAEAARDAEVVVLSTPWPATEAAIRACGSLAGKIVIDATNPLKTMNQVGYALMDHPSFKGGGKPVMFVAGDGVGRAKVLQLVSDLGFEAIDVGGLEYARLLEPFAILWIHLALAKGLGREFAFGLLRR